MFSVNCMQNITLHYFNMQMHGFLHKDKTH